MTKTLLLLSVLSGSVPSCAGPVATGADVLLSERMDMLQGRRVGLITNQTGVLSTGETTLSALRRSGVNVTALFAPEHGVSGTLAAGEGVADTTVAGMDLSVYSLYGNTLKPTPDMLRNVDVLVYDLQDVGVRFYTYISTMGLAMEAAAEQKIPFVVLDRPDPLGGLRIEGPVIDDSLMSFIGRYPIPVIYGLTCGELALMIAGEEWLKGGVHPDITVVPMKDWKREMTWTETGLPWIPPSPNIRSNSTVLLYPALALFEATNISEGRGTDRPFHIFGAPFVEPLPLLASINRSPIPGIRLDSVIFTPAASKHNGLLCKGLEVFVTEPESFSPVAAGIRLLSEVRRQFSNEVQLDRGFLGKLLGSREVVESLLRGEGEEAAISTTGAGIAPYREKRKKYLLYE
jgi:uncharacterized protein YbbC (DUF1343 family)